MSEGVRFFFLLSPPPPPLARSLARCSLFPFFSVQSLSLTLVEIVYRRSPTLFSQPDSATPAAKSVSMSASRILRLRTDCLRVIFC